MLRTLNSLFLAPKKRIILCLSMLLFTVFTIIIFSTSSSRLEREARMEEMIANQQSHVEFLESQYRARLEDIINLQTKMTTGRGAVNASHEPTNGMTTTAITPEAYALLKTINGTHAAAGIYTKHIQQLRTPFVYQLMPHLMNDPNSLKPAYHMKGSRLFSNIVIGIPTVKRDMESYLMTTLTHLIGEMSAVDADTTIIVIMVGDTDLEYVINIARQIEVMFPKQVEQGIIEVLSPSPDYYPNFDSLPDTLGDSHKRVKWRTKQNLDTIYLMAYAQSKGTFYLMLEDDVIAKNNYIQKIKEFTASTTVANPGWFYIEYCQVGGIGKLFRSADLIHFITYVQLFYYNMPIDWLLESYISDKLCAINKRTKQCVASKLKLKPKYKSSLFQHIGLHSSLKGKIHKIKDSKARTLPTFIPHSNPPLQLIKTDIEEKPDHSLKQAYNGLTYFWGAKPRSGDAIEFWFKNPTKIGRYSFRSGNIEHTEDRFYDTTVEVLAHSKDGPGNFTVVGSFDEFGIAEGELNAGPIVAIRLRVHKNSTYWVILSEIELKAVDNWNVDS